MSNNYEALQNDNLVAASPLDHTSRYVALGATCFFFRNITSPLLRQKGWNFLPTFAYALRNI